MWNITQAIFTVKHLTGCDFQYNIQFVQNLLIFNIISMKYIQRLLKPDVLLCKRREAQISVSIQFCISLSVWAFLHMHMLKFPILVNDKIYYILRSTHYTNTKC